MRVLEVGGEVFLLRFLPDNRLLFASVGKAQKVTFGVMSLADGARVLLRVPRANLDSWHYQALHGNAVAVHPGGVCYIAWGGRLHAFRTADGEPAAVPEGVKAHQVVLSPDGGRMLTAHFAAPRRELLAATTAPDGGAVLWRTTVPNFSQVAGFLPDGARFVTIEDVVRIRSLATGEPLAAVRGKVWGSCQPQVSQDGRLLGAMGYGKMYFWDLATLEKPRALGGGSNFGDFRSFAFHPNGRWVAVIHGGPTLIKVYERASLERAQAWNWKLGQLRSVAFSPDGTLGAAGSIDGRIVVWDID